ncbi:MAG: T6SS effector amidase Tae4 family protein [Serratia fonticola]
MPNTKTAAKTNGTTDSQKVILHNVITFDDLWKAYPTNTIGHIDPKTRKDAFDDHCAINVSASLYQCGILLKSFRDTRCWNCPTPDPVTKKGIHAIRAQELSDYLATRPFAGCPRPLERTGENFESSVNGKTGIIFFQDYWLRTGEQTPTGDHIDLWNKNELAGSGRITSFLRVNFPGATEYVSGLFGSSTRISDLTKAKKVLFWEIK